MAETSIAPGGSFLSASTSEDILFYTHFAYPVTLLILFVIAFAANSILSSSSESAIPTTAPAITLTGPGGKPLPSNTRPKVKKDNDFSPVKKTSFIWISAFLIATFILNAANICIHALADREHGWWCGEATTVSTSNSADNNNDANIYRSTWLRLHFYTFSSSLR
jgi:hypothetical protein